MNYNLVVIISGLICAILSYVLSFYLVELVLGKDSSFYKFAQLAVAIVSMTTFYAPIKHMLLKYMDVKDFDNEKNND